MQIFNRQPTTENRQRYKRIEVGSWEWEAGSLYKIVQALFCKSCDKMYVDYAEKTLSIVYKDTGEISEVQFFVAILGASQHTYAELGGQYHWNLHSCSCSL